MTGVYSNHHIITMPNGPVSVYESGGKTAPPVLLLHGAMYDEARLIWYHLAPFLSKTRRVLAIDFPRHGRSRPWEGPADPACLNQVIGKVVEHFGLPPLPFIGLSMVGGVTIGYMLQNPGQVTGAVLLGPGGLGHKIPNQFFGWLFTNIPGALSAMTRYYGNMSIDKVRKMLTSMLNNGENTQALDDLVVLMMEEAALKLKYREKCMDDWQLSYSAPFRLKLNYLPELHKLKCPTLWLRGENDPLISQRDMEEAARSAPQGELRVVKNSGHLLPLEQPALVNELTARFLAEKGI